MYEVIPGNPTVYFKHLKHSFGSYYIFHVYLSPEIEKKYRKDPEETRHLNMC